MANGYVSFASGLTAWALLALAIVSGGLDPGASLGPLLDLLLGFTAPVSRSSDSCVMVGPRTT